MDAARLSHAAATVRSMVIDGEQYIKPEKASNVLIEAADHCDNDCGSIAAGATCACGRTEG
jgi:hypothetical protein